MALSVPSYGQGGSYTAATDRSLNKANAVTAGVRRITGANAGDLAVTGLAAGTVSVAAGDGWIADSAGTGFYYVNNSTAATSAAFTSNGTGALRYDPVYLLIVDSGVGNPTLTLTIAAGSNVQPTFPALSLPLAVVTIPVGFVSGSSLTTATITDKRTKAQLWDFTVAGTSNVATPISGSVIFDTSVSPYGKLKVYDTNGSWNILATTTGTGFTNSDMASGYTLTYQSATAPSSPVDGQLWFDTANQRLLEYRSSDSTWQRIAHTAAAGRTGGHWRQSQGINTTWATALGWATEDYDTDNFIVAGASNRIFTIPAGLGGLYMATLRTDSQNGSGSGQVVIQWTTAAYGVVQDVGESGAAVGSAIVGSSTTGRMSVTGIQYMAAGDTITCYSRWSASATSATHEFQLVRLSI